MNSNRQNINKFVNKYKNNEAKIIYKIIINTKHSSILYFPLLYIHVLISTITMLLFEAVSHYIGLGKTWSYFVAITLGKN